MGEGKTSGVPFILPWVLVQWPATPSWGVLGAAESKAPRSQMGQGVRVEERRDVGEGMWVFLSQARQCVGSALKALGISWRPKDGSR